jgi:hypothetical protein
MRSPLVLVAMLAAGPALAQVHTDGRVWTVDTPKGAAAALNYGAPQSDDVAISLRCEPKSGQIALSVPLRKRLADRQERGQWVDKAGVRAPWPVSVQLTSEAASANLRGQARPSELDGGSIVTTEVSTAAPIVAAFRKTGVLGVQALGEQPPLQPAPKAAVRRFLGVCR